MGEALDDVGEVGRLDEACSSSIVEGPGQRSLSEGRGAVQKGTGGTRHADALVGSAVAAHETSRSVDAQTLRATIGWNRDVYGARPLGQAPERERRVVAEHRIRARGEDCCRGPFEGRLRWAADGVNAVEDAVKPGAVRDRVVVQPEAK